MSHGRHQNQGTGLGDVFHILLKLPLEQLQSLTFRLGESPEDNIVHALCLIILQKDTMALDKLQKVRHNCLAKQLAEQCPPSESKVKDFVTQCGQLQELPRESLVTLARMFKLLSELRLCDVHVTFLAYKKALSSYEPSHCEGLEYDQLQEEAKGVCGPHYADWRCSSTELKSSSSCDLPSSLDEGTSTLKVTLCQDQMHSAHSLPSPLQASTSMPSYPTHLEISAPPTACLEENRSPLETSHDSRPNVSVTPKSESGAGNTPGQSLRSVEPVSSEPPALTSKTHSLETLSDFTAESMKSNSYVSLVQPVQPKTDSNVVLPIEETMKPTPEILTAKEIHCSSSAEEEEEIFYAFVILHAPEDLDMAESMRDRLEKVIGTEGATYSDLSMPGKRTLRSVEDAINNTAFTILLLTRNFNSRMLEMKTDSALINSINKKHKYNTVIPLLPRENSLPRHSIPLVLQTIVPLEENRSFERKIQKVLSPAQIGRQRKVWERERMVKMELEKQERQKELNQHTKELITQLKTTQLLQKEFLRDSVTQTLLLSPSVPSEQDGGDGRPCWPRNIHIENAKYIMIGNDSQMTVELGGDQDGNIFKEEDQ